MTEVKEKLNPRRRALSFAYAFEGWGHVVKSQPNAWIHTFFTILVVLLAAWLDLPRIEWAILVLTMTVVWMAELGNTALEALVDMVAPDYHPLAKTAKDVAAATVLVGAIGAVLIGLILLGPPLWQRLFG